jgi:predicted RNase H-like HicB family nuclease
MHRHKAEGWTMKFTIESEQEADGRWIAEVLELPGLAVYGLTHDDAIAKVQALGLRVLADRLEHDDPPEDL